MDDKCITCGAPSARRNLLLDLRLLHAETSGLRASAGAVPSDIRPWFEARIHAIEELLGDLRQGVARE